MESDVVTLQDIFIAKAPEDESVGGGRLLNPLGCTGLKPTFLEKMAANGVVFAPTFFEPDLAGRPTFAASYGGRS
jgi:hypothetical protein